MLYFGNRRPRGFHHTFVYVDERKEWRRQHDEPGRPKRTDEPESRATRQATTADAPPPISWRRTRHAAPALRIGLWALLAVALAGMAFILLLFSADTPSTYHHIHHPLKTTSTLL